MKSPPQIWQIRSMRPLPCASMKVIIDLYNNYLSANASSDPIPKTINHVIPKVGGAILGLGGLNSMVIK